MMDGRASGVRDDEDTTTKDGGINSGRDSEPVGESTNPTVESESESDPLSDIQESDTDDDDIFMANVDMDVNDEIREWMSQHFPEETNVEDPASEYADSDQLDSGEELENEGRRGRGRGRPRCSEYKQTEVKEDFIFEVGMVFQNALEFRTVLKEYAIARKFDYELDKNESSRIVAKCLGEGCKWWIRASKNGESENFQVKTYYSEHCCTKVTTNKKVTSRWLAHKYVDTIRDTPDLSKEAFQNIVKKVHEVDISKQQCYRAKRIARGIIEGKIGEQYKLLWDYYVGLRERSPGSTIILKSDGSVFQRIYFCLEACKSGVKHCRPMIGLDACHLKGSHTRQLMCVVAKDGNDNIFPIAFAVVESENGDTWEWFVQLLLSDIGPGEDHGWTFISDQ